jgi:hypothetical protein
MVFSENTVFGKRRAYHSGLMVLPVSADNVFAKSLLWKRGIVMGVDMLPAKMQGQNGHQLIVL